MLHQSPGHIYPSPLSHTHTHHVYVCVHMCVSKEPEVPLLRYFFGSLTSLELANWAGYAESLREPPVSAYVVLSLPSVHSHVCLFISILDIKLRFLNLQGKYFTYLTITLGPEPFDLS